MKTLAVFLMGLFLCAGLQAGISIVEGPTTVSDDAATGYMVFAGISVQAGDVVAISTSPNKDASSNLLAFQWSGTEGVDGISTTIQSANLNARACYVFHVQVLNTGTYDFTITAASSSLTAQSTLFVLRADSSSIDVADSQTLATSTSTPGLAYDFSPATVFGGIAIESFVSKSGRNIAADAAYTSIQNGNGRFMLYSQTVAGGVWSKTHTCAEGAQDFVGAGAVFVESDASPQPPAFDSDPVVELNVTTNQAYSSTLANDASDPNGDPMIFLKISGPVWLNIATNGDLSGTPLPGDLGMNSWTVSVTDGISGTNSATLQITVMAGVPGPQTSQTNIVFFVIDDLGWMDLSCQGSEFYETPRIDQLAANGMRFTQGYAAHPRCLPSRYGILTGKFPGANGVPGGPESSLRPADVTVAETLQAGGYATFFAGKYHLTGSYGEPNLPQNQGFDINISGGKAGSPPTYWFPYKKSGEPDPTDELNKNALFLDNTTPAGGTVVDRITGKSYVRTANRGAAGEYITDRLTDEALDWMDSNADKPFFLYFSHYGVHTPFEAPQALVDKYTAKLATMDYGDLPEYISSGVGQQKMQQGYPTYAAMIESVDQSVGRVIDKLAELGISSNTVVMFTSDNGGLSNRGGYNTRTLATANHPLRNGKGWLNEGGIREPFIVSWPGMTAPGVNSNAVVNGTDFYPTMLEIAGLPLQPNEHQDGVSFLPALQGDAFDRGEPIFWHSPLARPYSTGDFKSSAVREGDYKLIWFYDTPGQPYELYNVRSDIGESNDLSEIMPAKATELLGKIQAWHGGAHDGLGVIFKTDDNAISKPPQAYLDSSTVSVSLVPNTGNLDLSWGDWTGFDYNLYSKTNLMDASWELEASGMTTNGANLPTVGNEGFYKVELILQPES
jgi:arylsulfatase A-like enzyme